MLRRNINFVLLWALLLIIADNRPVQAENVTYFTIATGGVGVTYYPLGGTIANAISSPLHAVPCSSIANCGVPGLIAVAQISHGSVSNINGISSGLFNSGFCQSDIAYWAYSGTGIYQGRTPKSNLRAIAALYAEHIQLIARVDANIQQISDLRGKRVSLDEPGSGTNINAQAILNVFGLDDKQIEARYLKPTPAADAIRKNELDAFFIVAGYPTEAVSNLARQTPIQLVPIQGDAIKIFIRDRQFYSQGTIPAGIYKGVDQPIKTLSVGSQWITSARESEELIYRITRALWNDKTRRLLDVGHIKGREVTLDSALDGIGIPLHPGAARYYWEIGILQ